jgi:hypothetical protein
MRRLASNAAFAACLACSVLLRLKTIRNQQFFLPRHAELILTARNGRQARNVMDFGNYRKFSAEAIFSFEKDR